MTTNIRDYIVWRGDIPVGQSGFNEVDSLILCQLSYIDFDGLIPPEFTKKGTTLAEAARLFFTAKDHERRADNGPLINPDTIALLRDAAGCARFGGMLLCGHVNRVDETLEKQFSATTFHPGDGTLFIAFRGTDNTIVGWKEDFNMAFKAPVPSQLDAADYVVRAAGRLKGKIRIGGHSKGGNLAIYAATFCGEKIRKRIAGVYNNDGPGFDSPALETEAFREVSPLIHTFIPQSSIIGMLLDHEEGYTVVESGESGIMQHDPLSWHVVGPHFAYLEKITRQSEFIDQTVKTWLKGMDRDRREKFIDTIFGIIQAADAMTISELSRKWVKNAPAIVKSLSSIDEETRKAVLESFRLLFRAAKKNMPGIKDLSPRKN